jgi:hypothetical protein
VPVCCSNSLAKAAAISDVRDSSVTGSSHRELADHLLIQGWILNNSDSVLTAIRIPSVTSIRNVWVKTWIVISAVAISRFIYLLQLPKRILIAFVPDDAFYYLKLAQSFSRHGTWSADFGLTHTSGFHPLYAYILSAIALFVHDPWNFLYTVLALNIIIFIAASAVVCLLLERAFGKWSSLGAVPVLLSWLSLQMTTSAMEWPLAVLFSAICFVLVDVETPPSPSRLAMMLSAGVLGTLARSDFVGVPVVLFCVFFGIFLLRNRRGRSALIALIICIGAIMGMLLLWAHDYWISGHILQSSVRMKLLWADRAHYYSLWNSFALQLHSIAVLPFPQMAWALLGIALIGISLWLSRRNVQELIEWTPNPSLIVASAAICLLYVVIYARNFALQPWYSANTVVALSVLCTTIVYVAKKMRVGHVVLIGSLAALVIANVYESIQGPWFEQKDQYDAVKYVEQTRLDGRIAAFGSGITSYFLTEPVVNLDGLVNDDVYDFVKRGDINNYVDIMKVRYILDCEAMFRSSLVATAQGVSDGWLWSRLTVVKVFTSDTSPKWCSMTLWRIGQDSDIRRLH